MAFITHSSRAEQHSLAYKARQHAQQQQLEQELQTWQQDCQRQHPIRSQLIYKTEQLSRLSQKLVLPLFLLLVVLICPLGI